MGAEELELLRVRTGNQAEYALHAQLSGTVTVDGETEREVGELVSGNYFDLLGVGIAHGRTLGMADEDPAGAPAVVISHALWVRRFRSDPAAVGRQVRISNRFATIVGVAAPGFFGVTDRLTPSDLWVTGAQMRDAAWRGAPIGRLKRNATFDEIDTVVRALSPRLAAIGLDRRQQAMSGTAGRMSDRTVDMLRRTTFRVRRASDVEMPFDPELRLIPRGLAAGIVGVVALVLVIATANIAGLLLARGMTRTGEIAVRRALGAGRLRLARQLLTESVMLSVVSGGLGMGLAVILLGLFRANAPARFGFDVAIDFNVLLFATIVCLITGVVAGLAPVRQAGRVNVLHALGGGVAGGPVGRRRLRHAIVIPQVALSLVLLVVAAVQTRGLLGIERAERGYRTEGITVFQYGRPAPSVFDADVARQWRERLPGLAHEIADRVKVLPQVTAVGLVSRLPLGTNDGSFRIVTEQGHSAGESPRTTNAWTSVTGGYFDVMGMQLLGRTFDTRDSATSAKVAVVSESLARSLWPVGNPIGQRFAFMQGARPDAWREVVGIVNDVRPVFETGRATGLVYLPVHQAPMVFAATVLVVRGAGDQRALVEGVKQAVVDAEPLVDVYSVRALSHLIDDMLYLRRLAAAVLTAAGVVGLLLACIGVYGVVSYSVEQRLREIGIRATLGADRHDIISLILRDGLAVIAWGAAAGLGTAVLSLKWAAGMVPGLPAGDALSYAAVSVALSAIVAAACLLPAYRASRVDPAKVLRGL